MSIFKDKVLLITGGTGSFGNAVLRRFLDSDIKEIRIFSRDEKKQDDMRHMLQNPKVKYYIGNVRDKSSVDVAMRGVDYVFSAAALKQVPSCEFFPMEATRTNVLGTANVLESAIEHGVKNGGVLQTDKAAYPINAMGISKALMEKVAIAKGRELGEGAATTICCTRFRDSPVGGADDGGQAYHDYRSQHDTFHDDAGRRRGPRDLCVPAWSQRRPLRAEGSSCHAFDFGRGAEADLRQGRSEVRRDGGQGDRHASRREALRDACDTMAKAIDMGNDYRSPCDSRDLNYDKFFTEGNEDVSKIEDYHSHNTARLDVEGMKKQLLRLRFIQEDLGMVERAKPRDIRSE